jgi:hypothetical protein
MFFELYEGHSGPYTADDVANKGAMDIISQARTYEVQQRKDSSTLDWFLLIVLFRVVAQQMDPVKGVKVSLPAIQKLAEPSHNRSDPQHVRAAAEILYKKLIPWHSDTMHREIAELLNSYNSGGLDEY